MGFLGPFYLVPFTAKNQIQQALGLVTAARREMEEEKRDDKMVRDSLKKAEELLTKALKRSV